MPLHEVLNVTLSDAADALKFSEIREMVNDMLQEVKFQQAALETCQEGAHLQNYVGRLVRPILLKEQGEQRSHHHFVQATQMISEAAENDRKSTHFLFSQLSLG